MEALEDENTTASIQRKVSSAGKRRHHILSTHHNADQNPKESSNADNNPKLGNNPWIENSFVRNNNRKNTVTESVIQTDSDDKDDSLNSSDFLMAQIDVELITSQQDDLRSPQQKRPCSVLNQNNSSNVNSRNVMSTNSSLVSKHQVHTDHNGILSDYCVISESNNNEKQYDDFSAEEDLFKDDNDHDFDDIFLLNSCDKEYSLAVELSNNKSEAGKSDIHDIHFSSQEAVKIENVQCFGEEEYKNNNLNKDFHTEHHAGNSQTILQKIENVEEENKNTDSDSMPTKTKTVLKSSIMSTSTTNFANTTSTTNTNVRRSGSLKERLKQRLQKNTGVTSPNRENGNNSELEKLKEEALSRARLEASQIRKEGCCRADIGPFYGLPLKVQELFETVRGISKLYDWQDQCLRLPAVRDRKNLIYSLPTSGGKTLVAEILILRELLCYQRDALLILPFVSIVQEKVRGLTEFATSLGFLVEEYAGSKGRFPPVKRSSKKSLFVATIEKGHSLINSLLEMNRLDSLGLVVVDELHMLGEGGSRGAALESALLKIIHAKVETQVIGMSATLNNLSDLQTFLQAEMYTNNFRPVFLQEYVKIEDNLFIVNPKALCVDEKLEHSRVTLFPYSSEILKRDPDQLLGLVLEVIPQNSCLLFCSTKKNCENVAHMLSELMCKHQRHLTEVNKEARRGLLKELYRAGNSKLCPILSYTVHFGIAYHHSGLTMDERRLIEEAYAAGTLCLLTCTSTLAAGVNLPAKRVILRSPYVGQEFIKYSQYKQMTGRAGRAGLDSSGESILIARKQDKILVKELLVGPKDFCHSSLLHDGGKGIQSLLLSAIGLKIIDTAESAFKFMESSLLSIQGKCLKVEVAEVCKAALQYLMEKRLVVQGYKSPLVAGDEGLILCLDVTPLGRATFKGCVNHQYSSLLYKDLSEGQESLVVSSHFHLLYLVTPYDQASALTPVWEVYFKRFCQLSETELRVASIVGISENYLSRKSIGLSSRQKIDVMSTNRFYLALMLLDLWNEKSVWEVAERFVQSRGFVQNLLACASSFASCVYHFCQELGEFWPYSDLLGNVVKRLSYCVTSELIPLMEVPGVLAARAKQLYSTGIHSLSDLAGSDADDLSTRIEHLSKRSARQIISAAKNLVAEKTAVLMEEVETLVNTTGKGNTS